MRPKSKLNLRLKVPPEECYSHFSGSSAWPEFESGYLIRSSGRLYVSISIESVTALVEQSRPIVVIEETPDDVPL